MAVYLPAQYPYVLLAASSSYFVNLLHGILTSRARKAAGQKYPIAYASNELAEKDPKAYAFNCAQRAHSNFTENLTPFLCSLLVAGLRFPVGAACLGGTWIAARAFYAVGYALSGPSGRVAGSVLGSLTALSLGVTAVYASVKFVLEM